VGGGRGELLGRVGDPDRIFSNFHLEGTGAREGARDASVDDGGGEVRARVKEAAKDGRWVLWKRYARGGWGEWLRVCDGDGVEEGLDGCREWGEGEV
jgi:hypothetical protein